MLEFATGLGVVEKKTGDVFKRTNTLACTIQGGVDEAVEGHGKAIVGHPLSRFAGERSQRTKLPLLGKTTTLDRWAAACIE